VFTFGLTVESIKELGGASDKDTYLYSYRKSRFYHFHYLLDENENDIANEAKIASAIKVGSKKHRKLNEPIEKNIELFGMLPLLRQTLIVFVNS
jgi:hypothetical protein